MREKKLPSQTLPDFQQYLLSRKLVPEKSVTFYAYWANRYLTFSKRLKNADAAEVLRRFIEDLQSRENIADWQIQQAKEAIQLYTDHFHGGKRAGIADDDAKTTLAPFDKDLGRSICLTLLAGSIRTPRRTGPGSMFSPLRSFPWIPEAE